MPIYNDDEENDDCFVRSSCVVLFLFTYRDVTVMNAFSSPWYNIIWDVNDQTSMHFFIKYFPKTQQKITMFSQLVDYGCLTIRFTYQWTRKTLRSFNDKFTICRHYYTQQGTTRRASRLQSYYKVTRKVSTQSSPEFQSCIDRTNFFLDFLLKSGDHERQQQTTSKQKQ